MSLVRKVSPKRRLRGIGVKAESLRWLMKRGRQVPSTYVIPWNGHAAYVQDRAAFASQLKLDLATSLDLSGTYAVRSSANVEDSLETSFAGQFETLLDVSGIDDLLSAVTRVLDSARSPRMMAYADESGIGINDIRMAVIVQEMVPPVVSGVVFSRNPITGTNEVVVEAVLGSGEALVQLGETPDRWVFRDGAYAKAPEDTTIDPELITRVIQEAKEIASAYSRPADLEWVYDGSDLYWVQIRDISSLVHAPMYSNRIAREVLPGMIKPLVWSVNVPLVNAAWIKLITELIGPNDLMPEDLAKSFHFRAYFNMGVFAKVLTSLGLPPDLNERMRGVRREEQLGRPSIRPSWRTLRHVPRMIRFVVSKMRYERTLLPMLDELRSTFAALAAESTEGKSLVALLAKVDDIYAVSRRSAYANLVVPRLHQLYVGLLRRRLKKLGIETATLDLVRDAVDEADTSPTPALVALRQQLEALDPAIREQLLQDGYAAVVDRPELADFRRALDSFLARFGHFSDSGNDFSYPQWQEDLDFVVEMASQASPAPRDEETVWDDLALSNRSRRRLARLYARARAYHGHREAISYLYTGIYSQFRRFFLTLGTRLADRGTISAPDDIFFLSLDEVRTAAEANHVTPLRNTIAERKRAFAAAEDVILPEVIYGAQAPPLVTLTADRRRLKGVPVSAGYYTGPARVVRSLRELDRVVEGDILVIPYSDVSWTPVFGRAGAVVSESGGLLSHTAIIAREYNLPAVVSVTDACRLLNDSEWVTIDGYAGEVILDGEESDI